MAETDPTQELDLELVRRVQRGDSAAFDLLVRKYQHRVVALIGRYIHDWSECQDVAQETFLRAYRALGNFRGDSQFYTWLHRIAVNTAKNHLVAHNRRPPTADVDAADAEQYDIGARLRDTEAGDGGAESAPPWRSSNEGKARVQAARAVTGVWPHSVDATLGDAALQAVDEQLMKPSTLPPAEQERIRAAFTQAVATLPPQAVPGLAVLDIAPEAFAVHFSSYVHAMRSLDLAAAGESGMRPSLLDRLSLSRERISAMAEGVRQVATMPDPVGEVTGMERRPNGLLIGKRRVPLGGIGIIYEARPNVTADAAGICLKSGNAVLLRGSASAYESNTALVRVIRDAVGGAGLPADAVQLVPGESRESVRELMRARGLVDVLIPRGGASLIRTVVSESTVPVIETGTGNCHVYVDAQADIESRAGYGFGYKLVAP